MRTLDPHALESRGELAGPPFGLGGGGRRGASAPRPPGRLTGDTVMGVDEVSMRELRNAGGEVLARVDRGESLTVTRDGEPVGELHPVPRPRPTREALLTRWRSVPAVDAETFREDVGSAVDPAV